MEGKIFVIWRRKTWQLKKQKLKIQMVTEIKNRRRKTWQLKNRNKSPQIYVVTEIDECFDSLTKIGAGKLDS